MLHQAMLSNASFDVENRENQLICVLFSQTVLRWGSNQELKESHYTSPSGQKIETKEVIKESSCQMMVCLNTKSTKPEKAKKYYLLDTTNIPLKIRNCNDHTLQVTCNTNPRILFYSLGQTCALFFIGPKTMKFRKSTLAFQGASLFNAMPKKKSEIWKNSCLKF